VDDSSRDSSRPSIAGESNSDAGFEVGYGADGDNGMTNGPSARVSASDPTPDSLKALGSGPTLGSSGIEGIDKPLVVLIPDAMNWVLGDWAREIAAHNAQDFDFVIFPLEELRSRKRVFSELMAHADIVHCLTWFAYADVERIIQSAGIRPPCTIASIHHIVSFNDIRACIAADRIHVVCSSVFEKLLRHGVPEEKLHLLRKGVDTALFRRCDRAESRKQLGLPENGFTIGFSAKATSDDRGRKGIDVLIDTLFKLNARPEDPIQLVVTGPGWENKLASLSIPNIAIHHFPFLTRSEMPLFYSAIDVYLSTARIEGGPMPPFEAMSCETPVVITPVGLALDVMSDGVEGLLVPIEDAAETAAALETIRREPERAAAMGRAGRATVERSLECREAALGANALYCSGSLQPRRAGGSGPTAAELRSLSEELIASDTDRWNEGLRSPQQPDHATGYERLRTLAHRVLGVRRAARAPASFEIAHIDLKRLRIARESRVLDLGCGAGQFTIPMLEHGYHSVGVDLDAPRLGEVAASCGEKGFSSSVLRADATNLPCRTASFDSVVCREMIEHIHDPGRVIEEIRRVLRPEGSLCVTVPSAHTEHYFQWVDSRWLEMAGHVNVFTRKSMRELLEAHGFRVVEIRGRNCFYSLFWFIHTLAGTTHDGTGKIQNNFRLADRVFTAWRWLRFGRLKRAIERGGNLLVPKSYVYYCERVDTR
jgi:glycosyltransferase involved in cell wall biosynthesis/SAM-dependent methyltransferase